jgi:hypothetical protein
MKNNAKRIQLDRTKLLAFRSAPITETGLSKETVNRLQGAMVGGKPTDSFRAVIGAKAGIKPNETAR